MTPPHDRRPPERAGERPTVQDAALALWLRHEVHAAFDPVLSEPLPEELLRLLDRHPARG